MEKKIALVISGNLRSFDEDKPNNFKISEYYSNIVKKYNIDVFCFTDDHNFIHEGKTYVKETIERSIDLGNHAAPQDIVYTNYETASNIISNILLKTFGTHLKKYKIIPYFSSFVPIDIDNKYHIKFYNTYTRPTSKKNNLLNSSYKLKCAYNLLQEYECENNVKYDLIIRCRFECIPFDILNSIDITKLDYTNTLVSGYNDTYIFDHGAIGDRYIMHHYCNYYNTISPNLLDNSDFFSISSNLSDISDSFEYGLTYLTKNIHNYQVKDYGINFRYFIPGCY